MLQILGAGTYASDQKNYGGESVLVLMLRLSHRHLLLAMVGSCTRRAFGLIQQGSSYVLY